MREKTWENDEEMKPPCGFTSLLITFKKVKQEM